MRDTLTQIISSITCHDTQEKEEIASTLSWIASNAPLFRLQEASNPPIHLVCYFALLEPQAKKLLLTDHKKAGLWLCPGGHVEVDEHPENTVKRELLEELGITAPFLQKGPFFLTVTKTRGEQISHTDISLWYLLEAQHEQTLVFDAREFHAIKWFYHEQIPQKTHPDMPRFIQKLQKHGHI